VSWWVHDLWQQNPALLVSWVVWVIGSIVLHELGHGWAAIWKGDRTPIETGHMTWNPLVHMGQFSLIAFALVGIAWGMMPVTPSRLRGRHAEAIVALAGPAMNLALFVVATVGGMLWLGIAGGGWTGGAPIVPLNLYENMASFFEIGAMLNIVLMLFNLVPVPPLDGSRIAMHYVPEYRRMMQTENGRWIALGGFVMLFMFGADYIFAFAAETVGVTWGALMTVLGL